MATATANDFSSTTGFVEQVKRSDNRVALKVGDNWFSTFGTCEANQGDEVQLKYTVVEKDGRTFRNIKSVEPVQPNPTPATPTVNTPPSKDEQISRAVALKTAGLWAGTLGLGDPHMVVKSAEIFLDWLNGSYTKPNDNTHQDDESDAIPF